MTGTATIRPELAGLTAYRWQETLPGQTRLARFDMNVPPLAPDWYPRELARLARVSPAAYPDATYAALREALAAYTGFPPDQIIPTAGCDPPYRRRAGG